MNRSLLSLSGIIGTAALAYYLGVHASTKLTSGGDSNTAHSALMMAALCCFVLIYIGLADSQIKHDALKEKFTQTDEMQRIASHLSRLSDSVAEANPSSPRATASSADGAGLNEALGVLTKDLASREKEAARLMDIIKRKESRNILARIATIRETAEFTRRINAEGKLDDKEALRQLIQEIEAAMQDLGLEVLHIATGTRVAELPNGCFSVLSATPADSLDLAGTVRESLSDAVYVNDDAGRAVFISPAKLRVYKL